jgi:hypothetical protein
MFTLSRRFLDPSDFGLDAALRAKLSTGFTNVVFLSLVQAKA